jgi:2-polyprenyl-6-methoxyphenol hydroxylase-like FAD-dependent oxidoreductase
MSSQHPESLPIAIIGTGFAGLTLANYLKLHDIPFQLFEASSEEPLRGTTKLNLPAGKAIFADLGLSFTFESSNNVPRYSILETLRAPVRKQIHFATTILAANSCSIEERDGVYLLDHKGTIRGPFRLVVGADGVLSRFRMSKHQRVALIGDARWAADIFWDLGMSRINQGGNIAMLDAIELGALIIDSSGENLLDNLQKSKFSARLKRASILRRRLFFCLIVLPIVFAIPVRAFG